MAGTPKPLIVKMFFFMEILQKKFIWSNLLGLLLMGRLVEFVVSEKSLYGVKQSPHAWFGKFSEVIEKFGKKNNKSDHSVFYRNSQADIILLLVYVDDIVIIGNDMAGISLLKSFFHG